MTLSRKLFLTSLAAAGAELCRAGASSAEAPLLKLDVLSDSHVTDNPETAEPLRRIFRHMAAENVDVVLHAGDICELGTLTELAHVAAAWKEAFPGGKNAAGRPVTPFFVFGNHDYHSASYMRAKPVTDADRAAGILYNKDQAWRMIAGEAFPGEVVLMEINGITFIGAHWAHDGEMAEWFKKHPLDANKPVFYVQHPHPGSTCFGGWAQKSVNSREILLEHANLFSVSGHSHVTVSDDRGIWQGGFVSMGAGSARLTSVGRHKDCENGGFKPWPEGVVLHMGGVQSGGAWQASIITVRPGRVEVARRDYRYGEDIGEPWRLDFPFRHDKAAPYMVADAARAPQFRPGAAVAVKEGMGKRRPDHVKERQVHVSVPAAWSDGPHSRAVYYRFEVLDAATGNMLMQRKVIQDFLSLAEPRTCEKPGWCAFARDELPAGKALVFRVYPLNAAERAGRPLESAPFTVKAAAQA